MSTRHDNLKALFESVFWPAAAGNVFWSFAALIVDNNEDALNSEVLSRLLVLALLSIYLAIEWLRNYRNFPSEVSAQFWLFDWLHICTVVAVALTASVRSEWLAVAAGIYFAVTALGHITNAWEAAETNSQDRLVMFFVNLSGIVVLIVGHVCQLKPWHLPASFAVVIALWAFKRRVSIKNQFAK